VRPGPVKARAKPVQVDVAVLGAGMVGVCVAAHLAERGRSVVLLDRRAPGSETSFGNAGLIQAEAAAPYGFPQALSEIFRHALNRNTDSHYHPKALLRIAPYLARYWWNSRPRRYGTLAGHFAALIRHATDEHAALAKKAGADALIRREGWLEVYRTATAWTGAVAEARRLAAEFGVRHEALDGAGLAAAEPALLPGALGALRWSDSWFTVDPQGLVSAYADYFGQLGGRLVLGDAASLRQSGRAWRISAATGDIETGNVVVALGPWADAFVRKLGYHYPLGVKRGYHMHYEQTAADRLVRPVMDAESGYMLVPMRRGIRLTTGAEFALHDAPSTPVQLLRAEAAAGRLLALGKRLDAQPWMGARPCTADMLPVIGPAPRHQGLWFAFGHAHQGLTLGPVTGRLLAEQMTNEATCIDPAPYRPDRFRG